MNQQSLIVFVCEHGAAKSILAAAYFNLFASETGLDVRAIARGTSPDVELSPQTVAGLAKDGLAPTESTPQKLIESEFYAAQRVVTFCELPATYASATVERWEDVPAVSESYEQAREVIVGHIRKMLEQ